jgi:hypothetical protein
MLGTRSSLSLALCFAIAALGACGDDATDTPDMSAAPSTCGQIATCVLGAGGMVSAITACVAKGTAAAQMKYQALQGCAVTQCLMPGDGGAAACTSAMDKSAGCVSCATAAGQSAACSTQLTACTSDK